MTSELRKAFGLDAIRHKNGTSRGGRVHRHEAAAAVAAVGGGFEGTATTHPPEWHSPTPSRRVLAAQLGLAITPSIIREGYWRRN